MPVKPKDVLRREDFSDALVSLRTTLAEVSKATQIPRSYLSEFRAGDRRLRPEQLAKLRDHFESQGVEFEDADDDSERRDSPNATGAKLRTRSENRTYLPIGDGVPIDTAEQALGMIADAEVRLAVLLQQRANRDAIFGEGEMSDETIGALQEAFALLAKVGALLLLLRGSRAFKLDASRDRLDTISSLLTEHYRPELEELGLVQPLPERDDEDDDEEDGGAGDAFARFVNGEREGRTA